MGSAGWTVCHSFKTPSCCDDKGACVRVRVWVWLHICQPGRKQACLSAFTWFRCVVPRHFWQGQIKKSVRVCWSSKQSAVGTLHWGSVNHFRDSRDEMCHLKDLCSVTLLRWQLPNHVSQATLKVDQIMAFCAIHHSVFSTDMRKFVTSIGYRPLVNNFKIPQYSSTLTGVHTKVIQIFLSWFSTLPDQERQIPHYFLFFIRSSCRGWQSKTLNLFNIYAEGRWFPSHNSPLITLMCQRTPSPFVVS